MNEYQDAYEVGDAALIDTSSRQLENDSKKMAKRYSWQMCKIRHFTTILLSCFAIWKHLYRGNSSDYLVEHCKGV